MKVVYANYQRLGRAGKQTQKILFKKKIIVKSWDNAFHILFFPFPSFSHFLPPVAFCILFQALDGVYVYVSAFGYILVSFYV